MSQDYPNQPAPQESKSILPTCLVSCLVLFILLLVIGGVGAYIAAKRLPGMIANKAGAIVIEQVEASEMDPAEKEKVIVQVRRLQNAAEQGKIGLSDAAQIADKFVESPLLPIAMVQFAHTQYIAKSGLTDEEKQAGKRALDRVARGMFEGSVEFSTLEARVMPKIATKTGENRWEFKKSVDDATVQEMIAECQAIADEAEIPEEEFHVSVGDELKKIVDDLLAR